MEKKKSKAVKTKAVKKPVVKEFKLRLEFNDEVFEVETDNLCKAIGDLAPDVLKTHVKLEVKQGKLTAEKFILLQPAKFMFWKEFDREIIVNRLIFK